MKTRLANTEISAWLWLGFPLLFLAFIVSVVLYDYELGSNMVAEENNLVELGTVIVLIPGIATGILCFRLRHLIFSRRLIAWIMLVTAAGVYFTGEELSWGQQLFNWETPEKIQAINDQNETNLHNISSWLDQKPRLLVELWVLVGGIVLPLWRYSRRISYSPDSWRYWFWPDHVCLPAATLAILVKVPERLKDNFDYRLFEHNVRYSELQEFYIALFLSMYLYSFYIRLKKINLADKSR